MFLGRIITSGNNSDFYISLETASLMRSFFVERWVDMD